MVNTRAKAKKARKADSDRQSTQSAAFIGSNDDLLTDILRRLPVTSILRFKSVSKHWRLLLSDSHFTRRYDKLLKSPGLFVDNEYVPFDVENPSTPPFRSLDSYFDSVTGVAVLQSCNGLLLCCTSQVPRACKSYDKYYVFNPTTKQLALIPSIRGGLKARRTISFMGLAFQTDCVHYKLVCVRSLEPGVDLFQIQIYFSDTRKWKISIQSFSASKLAFLYGVYWNGAVNWAPFYCNQDFLYFKIDDEQLQTLPLPVGSMSFDIWTMYFGESRGHLHLILYKNLEDNYSLLNVYEMLSDHSGWFVKYQLQLDQLVRAFPDMISGYGYHFKVIDVVSGEEEDTFVVPKIPGKIITYNVHAKSFKLIFTFNRYSCEGRSGFHRYTETLSSF